MKKLMMLAALLAMVLVAAAPALAQAPSVNFGDEGEVDASADNTAASGQYSQGAINDCEQILDQEVDQNNQISGDQTAVAVGEGEGDTGAAAGNDQDNTVSAEQVQYCVNLLNSGIVAGGDVTTDGVDNDEDGVVDEGDGSEAEASASAAAAASSSAAAGSASADADGDGDDDELPATGGVSLLTLGAGADLVAGGLVARRIVR